MRFLLTLFGPFSISSYGLSILIGCALAYYFLYRDLVTKKIITDEQLSSLALYFIIGAGIGGKLVFILEAGPARLLQAVSEDPARVAPLLLSGYSLLGALIGVIAGLFLAVRRIPVSQQSVPSQRSVSSRAPTRDPETPFSCSPSLSFIIFDSIALYAPLMEAFGRIGCFYSGCCYGYATTPSCWSVIYTDPYSLAPLGISLFPAQLLMCALSLALFGGLLLSLKWGAQRGSGKIAGIYVMFMALSRFVVDFVRADRGEIWWWGITHYQAGALVIASFAGLFLLAQRVRR